MYACIYIVSPSKLFKKINRDSSRQKGTEIYSNTERQDTDKRRYSYTKNIYRGDSYNKTNKPQQQLLQQQQQL